MPMKAEVALSPYSQYRSPQQNTPKTQGMYGHQEKDRQVIAAKINLLIDDFEFVPSQSLTNKYSQSCLSSDQSKLKLLNHQSSRKLSLDNSRVQSQQKDCFYNRLAQRFKAKQFDSVFTARERSKIIQDLLLQPDQAVQEWIKRQQQNSTLTETADEKMMKQNSNLILPSLNIISPRFSGSVGKQYKEKLQKKNDGNTHSPNFKINQVLVDAVAMLKQEVALRHGQVIEKVKNPYQKRALDPEGNWKKQVGRKLQTQQTMILKDYSKSQFFKNPLKPTPEESEGLHQIHNAQKILKLTDNKQKTDLNKEIHNQHKEKLVIIEAQKLTFARRQSQDSHAAQQVTTLMAPPPTQHQEQEVKNLSVDQNISRPPSPQIKNEKHSIELQTSFLNTSIDKDQTSMIRLNSRILKSKYHSIRLPKVTQEPGSELKVHDSVLLSELSRHQV